MFDYYKNHNLLFGTAFIVFLLLALWIAVFPAYQVQENNKPLAKSLPLTEEESHGMSIYVREGCSYCHTQQVRSIAMDEVFGNRPAVPADYARKDRLDFWRGTPSLLGTERTGPDLTNIGNRQQSMDWHLLHLYNPRSTSKGSIMPNFHWLFKVSDVLHYNDVEVHIPVEFMHNINGKLIATQDALDLVKYLQSLKQVALSGDEKGVPFTDKKGHSVQVSAGSEVTVEKGAAGENTSISGLALYSQYCQSCHQSNGEGLKGAFPPLKGSSVVNDPNPEKMATIIINGYHDKPGFGPMPGFSGQLSDEQITLIMNFERTSWGNKGTKVSLKQMTDFRKFARN